MVITKTMTDEQFFLDKLKHRDIRPTATRLLILREMMRGDEAVSLPDLERLRLFGGVRAHPFLLHIVPAHVLSEADSGAGGRPSARIHAFEHQLCAQRAVSGVCRRRAERLTAEASPRADGAWAEAA